MLIAQGKEDKIAVILVELNQSKQDIKERA